MASSEQANAGQPRPRFITPSEKERAVSELTKQLYTKLREPIPADWKPQPKQRMGLSDTTTVHPSEASEPGAKSRADQGKPGDITQMTTLPEGFLESIRAVQAEKEAADKARETALAEDVQPEAAPVAAPAAAGLADAHPKAPHPGRRSIPTPALLVLFLLCLATLLLVGYIAIRIVTAK